MSAREARERETCCHRRLCNAHGAWKAVGHARVTRSPFCKEVSGRGNRLLLPALAHHAQARRLGSSTSSSTASGSAMPHALITDARRQSQARTVPVSAFHHSPRARGSCVPDCATGNQRFSTIWFRVPVLFQSTSNHPGQTSLFRIGLQVD